MRGDRHELLGAAVGVGVGRCDEAVAHGDLGKQRFGSSGCIFRNTIKSTYNTFTQSVQKQLKNTIRDTCTTNIVNAELLPLRCSTALELQARALSET